MKTYVRCESVVPRVGITSSHCNNFSILNEIRLFVFRLRIYIYLFVVFARDKNAYVCAHFFIYSSSYVFGHLFFSHTSETNNFTRARTSIAYSLNIFRGLFLIPTGTFSCWPDHKIQYTLTHVYMHASKQKNTLRFHLCVGSVFLLSFIIIVYFQCCVMSV